MIKIITKRTLSVFTIFLFCSLIFAKGKGDIEISSEPVTSESIENGAELLEFSEDTEALSDDIAEKEPVQLYTLRPVEGKPVAFAETWGYVSQGREDEYDPSLPITDVCYFSAEINCYGELSAIPVRSKLKTGKARCHLVITCDSRSLTHFVIDPEYGVRKTLLKSIVKAAAAYDGVQIDFELVPTRDRKHFLTFLADLRYMLGQAKWFTVCVPARFKRLTEDVYPYSDIANYSDRVFVMAYDEHWSSSVPGPVASVDWCQKVLEYAQKAIPEKKLIMGIPFYGRFWAEQATSGAYYFSRLNRMMIANGVEEITYEKDIPKVQYTTQVDVTGYFNDAWSDVALLRMYQEAGVKKIGFWRVGQEDPEFWNWLEIKK